MIREPSNKRNKDNEYQKASAIVNDLKWIKAHECIMRYADIIKDNEMVIQMSKGDPRKVNDLLPYVESVLWGGQKVNLDCINAFGEFVIDAFGADVYSELCKYAKVTQELKDCFDSILPSEKEVKTYLIELCKKNNIKLDVMNEINHNLSEGAIEDTPNKNTTVNNNINNFGGQPNFNPNQNFPNNLGGYPGNYGYPQPGGNFGNGGYNPGNFGNYQPPNYGQGTFGNPNGGNFGNNPGNFGGYPQGGNFGGYPQGGNYGNYPGNYGGFQPSDPNQQGFQPQGNQPSGITNITVTFDTPNNQNIPNQNTTPTTSNTNNYPSIQNNSAYPTFEKFTIDNNMGGKSNDPLDELDLRLKNIKDGL